MLHELLFSTTVEYYIIKWIDHVDEKVWIIELPKSYEHSVLITCMSNNLK